MFSGDYDDLLTLEMALRISGFEPSKARKTHLLKGMTGEILRYNWENGRERKNHCTGKINNNIKIVNPRYENNIQNYHSNVNSV